MQPLDARFSQVSLKNKYTRSRHCSGAFPGIPTPGRSIGEIAPANVLAILISNFSVKNILKPVTKLDRGS